MKQSAIFLCFSLVFGMAAAVSAEERFSNRLSLEVVSGYYKIPGMLLGMDKSIVEHPQHLIGEVQGLRGNYEINDNWLLGAAWLKIVAFGGGNWARSDTAATFAANGVDGVVTGRTDIELRGVVMEVERRFFKKSDPVRPYVRLGAGAGELTVNFQGKFVGHETSSGFNFPVKEDAHDNVKRTIPVLSAEFGLRFMFTKHLNMLMGGFWNTGYGALVGAGWRF